MERLFFALRPCHAAARRIAESASVLRSELGLRGKLLPPERLHITLHLLGDFPYLPANVVACASRIADHVAERQPVAAFDLSVDRAMSFRRNVGASPFAAQIGTGKAQLVELWLALGAALRQSGFPLPRTRPSQFTPHVTLMYGDPVASVQPITPISWTANEFVLIHSLLGRGQHVQLGHWPLASNPSLVSAPTLH